MKKGEKVALWVIIFITILLLCSIWLLPERVRIAEATEFKGDGNSYTTSSGSSSSGSSASSTPSSTPEDLLDDAAGDLNNMLGGIRDSIGKLDDSLQPGQYADVEAPTWVKKLSQKVQQLAATIAVSLQTVLFGVSGFWYLNCLAAIAFDKYYHWIGSMKFPCFGKHLYEVKDSAGVARPQPYAGGRQPQQQGGYDYNQGRYNPNYNQGNYNQGNYNQPVNNQQNDQGNPQNAPGVISQIATFTVKHIIFVALMLIMIVIVQLGYIEKSVLMLMELAFNLPSVV